MKFILTCPYNTTQIAKKELEILWYKAIIVSSTSLSFEGDADAIARVNLWSRVGNKLFLEVVGGPARTFDELFEIIVHSDRSQYIAPGTPITVDAVTKRHPLTSVPAIQGIGKKAITRQLTGASATDEHIVREESAAITPIEVVIHLEGTQPSSNSRATYKTHATYTSSILINTTWPAMHNRGYRAQTGDAPIKENLAAALVLMSGWKFSTPLIDPFCGSGTIPIEAALIAKNIAPGLARMRNAWPSEWSSELPTTWFAFQWWSRYDQTLASTAMTDADAKIMLSKTHTIIGYDNDAQMISSAQNNAKLAGVWDFIRFSRKEFPGSMQSLLIHDVNDETAALDTERLAIVTNPPYGERMQAADLKQVYTDLIDLYQTHPEWNGWFITSAPANELIIENMRKDTAVYNGPIECWFYKIARL
jgi:putative N6-adenine-specific DNA methylase